MKMNPKKGWTNYKPIPTVFRTPPKGLTDYVKKKMLKQKKLNRDFVIIISVIISMLFCMFLFLILN